MAPSTSIDWEISPPKSPMYGMRCDIDYATAVGSDLTNRVRCPAHRTWLGQTNRV